MEIPEAMLRQRPLVDAEMRAVLHGRALPIYDMVRYTLGWQEADGTAREGGGKGMRPALALMAAAAVGEQQDDIEAALARAAGGAAAVEFVHSFSLVHDDIQDSDDERHHRPTVWRQWGVPQAINVGDALRELAAQAMERARVAGASAEAVATAHATLSRAALEMIEGQYLDLCFEERTAVSLNEYLDMIERKTGALVGCAMAIGALLAGANADACRAWDQAGRRLGLCFQIRDDYLGVWGDPAATGKISQNDIRRRKKSYPVVFAFQAAPTSATNDAGSRADLERLYAQPELSEADVQTVSGALAAVGAAGATEQAARAQRDAAQEALGRCALGAEARAAFNSVVEFALKREH